VKEGMFGERKEDRRRREMERAKRKTKEVRRTVSEEGENARAEKLEKKYRGSDG
jgi:hypothetical protein